MKELNRKDIHIISANSNWSDDSVQKNLEEKVYSNKEQWGQFLNWSLLSSAIGFLVAGVIFFFAFNWADLHKFVKIGLVEGLIIVSTLFILITKLSKDVKMILLTGAAVLVGVLFAVFGQIYQTGANAYDFFQGWTLSILIWVLVANFPPLWLLFLILINTTLILYSEQVANDWSFTMHYSAILLLNLLFLIFGIFSNKIKSYIFFPNWLNNMIVLAITVSGTLGMGIGLLDDDPSVENLGLIVFMTYAAGIYLGYTKKSIYYLAIISFSSIFIFSSMLIKISDSSEMFYIVSLFVLGAITAVIMVLLFLQKKWKNEQV